MTSFCVCNGYSLLYRKNRTGELSNNIQNKYRFRIYFYLIFLCVVLKKKTGKMKQYDASKE